jgi:YD repeat-containing protein
MFPAEGREINLKVTYDDTVRFTTTTTTDHEIDYDKANRKTIVTDSLLRPTVYQMNRDGLVVSVQDAKGGETTYEYDEESFQVTAETDPLGRTTRRSYDGRGNLSAVIEADGSRLQIDNHPELDVPVRVTTAAGSQWQLEYDSLGHVTRRVLPTGEATRFEWEGGLPAAMIEAGDRRTTFQYDGAKNLVGVRLANGAQISYEVDGLGRVRQSTDPRGTTKTTFDLEGRPVETISPTGVAQRMAYDGEGNLLESRDATRHVRLRYGHFHKLVERQEAGTSVRFEYDTEDNLVAVVNEAGERYLFERDPLGEVASETGFDGQKRVYFRDAVSQVTKVLLPGSRWEELSYDKLGRVTEVTHFDGSSESYEYDLSGGLIRAANDETEVVFERDALGRVVAERTGEVVVSSRYGADGARAVVESNLGARQAVLYDALGEVESLHHGPVNAFWRSEQRFGRDPLGAELSRHLPGGLEVLWNRDASGKPTSRRTLRSQPGARPIELNARGYQWRGEDQIGAIVDAMSGPRWFDHDSRGRLIRERRPGSSPIHGDDVLHRAMDAVGNIYRSPEMSDRRYGPGGRIEQADGTKYEHDELGNLVKKTEPDGSQWRYHWNGAGMLVKVERPDGKCVGFEYDVFARRTRKTLFTEDDSDLVGPRDPRARRMQDLPPWEPKKVIESETRFVWDGHTVLHELSSDEGLTTWYWEPGTFTPIAKERGKHFWSLVHDHLGTPTEMCDEQGQLVWQMESRPGSRRRSSRARPASSGTAIPCSTSCRQTRG